MTEIVCTCEGKDTAGYGHRQDCPMVTGVGRRIHIGDPDPSIKYFSAEEGHLLSTPEPILADVLRDRLYDGEIVILHTDDGGKVGGLIESVSDDGTVATVVEGRDQFEIDVTKIVVVQTLRRGKPPRGS